MLPSHWEGIEDEFETTHTGRESNKRNECPPVYNDVDWVAAGKVSPVKDQGGCGSCYAFTANTVLESMISIVENKAPKRLSEQ